jgi:outer membrane protein OmpA-like peptidoglycan-associated protein
MNKFYKALVAGLIIIACGNYAKAEDSRDVVRDERHNIIKNTFNNCVLTQWANASNPCGGGEVASAPAAEPRVFDLNSREARTIYFDFDKYKIKAGELDKLDSLADALKSEENLRGVHIVGYADRLGSEEYNQALSQKRAQEVEAHLREQGYLGETKADTRWLGESEPITQCPENMSRKEKIACLQKDRRVEVELDYIKRKW